jgi:peptidoglycan hydrolase-like protein with peptidoglycan-binding domain
VAQDHDETVKWYRLAAEQGVATAQYNLGIMYDRGEGVAQDHAEAAEWYRRAAERDFAKAQFSLGVMYEKGQGVPQDYGEAVKWYRLAAAQGSAKAMNNIGLFYQNGFDVPRDLAKAYAWYSLAADRFGPGPQREQAARNRDGVANELSPQQLGRAQRLARAWSPGTAAIAAASPPTRAFVALVQDKLLLSGHDPGPVDGMMGSATRAAIRAFQAARQIPITGEISEELLRELDTASLERTAPPPTPESSVPAAPTGALIARVQERLARSGHDPGPADGIMGPKTRAAILAFQAAKDIPVTGKVSEELLRELEKAPAD